MRPWALVPVKRFDQGKSRLGEALAPAERVELARAMFDRVVVRVLGAMVVEGDLGGALVVTDGPEVFERARTHGIDALLAPGTGPGRKLGTIVDEGLAALTARGAGAALVIMGDLPTLAAEDVRALAGLLDGHDLVLAPDANALGTNALAVRLPPPMPTRFRGGDSLADHLADARSRGLRVAMCERPGFGFDVDQPEDYARLRATTQRTLTTERLTLRPHTLADFEDVAALWADPAVTRFIGGRTSTREESWARLLRYVGHWSAMGFGYWVVRETETRRFVGEVGPADFQREIEPPFQGAPEFGWVLSPAFHGRGYAGEAVRAVLTWSEARFGPGRRFVCMIDPGNAPSIRVAQKVGFREFARTTYKGSPVILFER